MHAAHRVVARFEARKAEDLTYGWLLKVKKGWKATVEAPGPILEKIEKLDQFVLDLVEQVQFKQHGMSTQHPTMSKGKAVTEAQKAVHAKLRAVEAKASMAKFNEIMAEKAWEGNREDISEENGGKSVGLIIRELGGYDEFKRKYPEDEKLSAARYEAQEVVSVMGKTPKTFSTVTTAFEKLMALLYQDAKDLAQFKEQGGETDDEAIDKVFDLYGMKIVIAAPDVTPNEARTYLRRFDEAYARLKQKKLAWPWYGVTFVESLESRKFSEELTAEYAKLGYKDMRASAGMYHDGKDRVVLTNPPDKSLVGTIVHELGHRYWVKKMTGEQRARFNGLVRTNPAEETRGLPPGWLETGEAPFNLGGLLDKFRDGVAAMAKDLSSRVMQNRTTNIPATMDGVVRTFESVFEEALKDAPPGIREKGLEMTSALFAPLEGFSLYTEEELAAMTLLDLMRFLSDWRKHDAPAALREFEKVVAQELAQHGKVKPVTPVSDYGRGSIDEAFAEAWEHYVMGGDMDRDQLESFRSVLSHVQHARLVRAFFDSLAEA